MGFLIVILVVVVVIVAFGVYSSSQANKFREEIIAHRKKYVETICPTARIIVNNGTHLFFKDDEQQLFGLDETGKTYSFSGLHSISTFRDVIEFMHSDSMNLRVGRDYGQNYDTSISLDHASVIAIEQEMMPVLRKNLYAELEKEGVSPTHEYEHEGEIWGCDINSKKFYTTYGCSQVYNFSDLRRVTIEDLRDNTLYDGSYSIHVYVKSDYGWDDSVFDIHIGTVDSTYYNLLAMFKGIQNRK